MQYKILWLDDDFIGPQPGDSEGVIERRESFLEDAKQSKKFNLDYDSAATYDEFEAKFRKGHYHAVVLDIMDLNPMDSQDNSALFRAVRLVEKTAGVLIYVYSGNIDKLGFKDFLKSCPIIREPNIFDKTQMVEESLFPKIREDLDKQLQFYAGHEECLNLLNKGYLTANEEMDRIVQNESVTNYSPYNDIRQVLENMLDTLCDCGVMEEEGKKKEEGKKNDVYDTFNKRMFYLTQKCESKNDHPDWDKPKFPYKDCSREMKWTLDFLGNITNRYSHFHENHQEFLLEGEALSEYDALIKQATYSAFYAAMKWYHGYMTTKFGK